jgi:signal transduction histidine kinase
LRPFVVRPSSFVIFEVADTGAGIPPDKLPRIFERFYRTDKARARETGGSGLGLAIVQRLVEMQGGRIWATSAVGQGTIFYVALPAAGETRRQETRKQASYPMRLLFHCADSRDQQQHHSKAV